MRVSKKSCWPRVSATLLPTYLLERSGAGFSGKLARSDSAPTSSAVQPQPAVRSQNHESAA